MKQYFVVPVLMAFLITACGGGDAPPADSNNDNTSAVLSFPVLTSAPQFDVSSAVAGDVVTINLLHTADVSSITFTVSSPDNCTGCLPAGVDVAVAPGSTSTSTSFSISSLSQTSLNSLASISMLNADSTLQTLYSPSLTSSGYYSERKYEIGTANNTLEDTSYLVAEMNIVNTGVTYFLETYCNASGTSNGGVALTIYDADGNSREISARDELAGDLYSAEAINLAAGTYHLAATAADVYDPGTGMTTYPIGDYNLYAGVGQFNASKPVCGATTTSVVADAREDADDVQTGATVLTLNAEEVDLTSEATLVVNGGSVSYAVDYDWFVFVAP